MSWEVILEEETAPRPHYAFDFLPDLFRQEHRTSLASYWPKEVGRDAVCLSLACLYRLS